jgi:diguanylate cyclase (GGDEF)-like protein
MDLPTLWHLTIGTLLVGAAMTLWERNAHARRSGPLGIWATSYVVFAIGCIVAMNRQYFPGASGAALTNLLMVTAYLMVWHGAAGLDRPVGTARSVSLVTLIAFVWSVAGARYPEALWNHAAAFPIAVVCGFTAWSLLRSRTVASLRSRPIAVAVFAGHGLFYLFRSVGSPIFASVYGVEWLPIFAKATMYEAVLFAVAMPMAFLALVREEEQARLLKASHTDFLTGLPNRLGFFERASQVILAGAPNRPLSLLAMDLDHFKGINDRYGHEAGDRVLKVFADVARELAGDHAEIVRLGGEEFAILLPNQGANAARKLGERLSVRFTEKASEIDGLNIRATVSVGVAETKSGSVELATLLSAADRALYRAKALGRNRIETAISTAA